MLNIAGRTQVQQHRGTQRLPSLVREMIGLVHDPGTHVARLASALSGGQPYAAGRGSLNFPLSESPSKTYNIGLATILLGFNVLKETVTRVVVSAALQKLSSALSKCEDFWNHSIAVGVTTRRVAEKHAECDPDNAFIAGLFHGIGTIVLHEDPEGGPHYGEETSWSTSAIESASVIAARWGLPLEVVEAIRYCRTPWLAQANVTMTSALHVADVLCHRLNIGARQQHYLDEFDERALRALQLGRKDLNNVNSGKLAELARTSLSQAPRFETLANGVREGFVYALTGLPDRQKLIVALRFHEDLSYAEIAQVMGLREPDVVEMYAEAVQGLRSLIVHSN